MIKLAGLRSLNLELPSARSITSCETEISESPIEWMKCSTSSLPAQSLRCLQLQRPTRTHRILPGLSTWTICHGIEQQDHSQQPACFQFFLSQAFRRKRSACTDGHWAASHRTRNRHRAGGGLRHDRESLQGSSMRSRVASPTSKAL